ncbi:MAG TPA: GMC family oxidoreductase N-terminal domain-containing protein [Stellaceae bacterium]|jgi:choline dehydrogenase|nr:GMC family oxidoreductase N-terminal domain-containing protein [Stellaceae bacterium]
MPDSSNTYDFIVTGAGSAGCAVAGRLSESGKYKVLLLEAGTKDTNPWIHVPLGYTKTYTDPKVNWMFDSEPEKELNGRTLYQPRGKVLGGTSSINGMVYMRGTPTDYDGWRQRGCEGWGWDDVLPFFKKAQDQERGPSEFHGTGGPLHVSNPVRCALGDAMVQAAVEAGVPANDDFNGARQEGVGYYQTTTTNRRRWSSARAYLGPAKGRANLTISTQSHATRILFEGQKAIGVEYQTPEGRKTAYAKGEIVVSGGVYGSPQLLQLSGVGPGELLQEFGVPVVRDMEGVGKHLHDHFNTYLVWRCSQKVTLNDLAASPLMKLTSGVQYVFTRSGHLSNAGIYAGAFVKSDPRLEQPDLQINMFGWSAFERLRTGIKPHPFSAFTLSPVHLRPEGRGTVRLKSADPLAAPAIRFNFLASEYDFQALIYGTRFSRKIVEQAALKPFVMEEVIPGLGCQSDEDIKAEIRVRGVSNLHPVGTCRMGRNVDDVVDPRLKVHGIEHLRVADASIMPQVPGGNTNAPSIMIGEKCAAMILEDARAA